MTASEGARRLARVLDHLAISLVLDVGANTGQYGARLRRAGYGGRIVSFEPLAEAHRRLRAAAAEDDAWQVPAPLALGDAETPLTLNRAAASDMSSALDLTAEMAGLLDDAAVVARETAPQARLERIWPDHVRAGDRVLLKIDTQGYDDRVLAGAAGVIGRLSAIQLELSIVPVYEGQSDWREMVDRLDALGFSPVLFLPGYFNRSTARLIEMDGVFVNRAATGPTVSG